MSLTTQQMLILICAGFLIVNFVSGVIIWVDKQRALKDELRVKEETLLVWALLGGWPGGIWSMKSFRHKISKQPFIVKYLFAATLNLGVTAGIVLVVINR